VETTKNDGKEMINYNKLNNYLKNKFRDETDFVIVDDKIYTKSALSFQTIMGISEINVVKAVFYTSTISKPFSKGFRLGILLEN
jgi:hypothetical protein